MDLVIVFGPPAVGKMTVGHELGKLTGYKLFHNHMAIEPLLDIFPFGSPPFARLVDEFRRRVIEEAADAALPGLIFTFVWALEEPDDARTLGSYAEVVTSRGGRVHFVELAATQEERLRRNTTAFRLEHKRSKRDLEFSREILLLSDERNTMNTDGDFHHPAGRHVRIDNTHLSAGEVAQRIVTAFDLPMRGAAPPE